MRLRLEPFSRDEVAEIHAATVRVLGGTGVRVLDPEAAFLLTQAGALPGASAKVFRIPESLLADALGSAPRRFRLHGRGPGRVLAFGEGNTYLSSVGTAVQVEDVAGDVGPARLEDVERFYRLTDALPHIDHSSWVVWPRDVPEEVGHLYEILYGFRYTTKSFDGYNWGRRPALDTIEMAAIVAGGPDALAARPLLLGFCNPVSPLTLAKETTEGLIAFARHGQPTTVPPECMAGGTSPATLAGSLVQQNSEILASVVIAQLARRGAPILYGSASTVMDMKTGTVALGAPEAGLLMTASAQLARHYGLPSRGTGGNTEALTSDYQAGAETFGTLLLAYLAGFDFIYDAAGSLESSLTAGYVKMILDHEVCGEVKRIAASIEVSEESLAAEVIEVAGPKGNYLGHPHTLRRFRAEHYAPDVFRRTSRSASRDAGEKSLWGRARDRCEAILRDHVVDPPLDREVETRLLEYVDAASKRYGVQRAPAVA